MGLFGNRQDRPPDWWRFSKGEWREFVTHVREAMRARNTPYSERFEIGGIQIEGGAFIGLANLAARWHEVPKAGRLAALVAHFEKAVTLEGQAEEISDLRSALRATIYPQDFLPAEEWLVRRRPCSSWQATLALDFEGGIRLVRSTDLDEMGLTPDEAFALAIENNHRAEPYGIERIVPPGAGTMTVVHGDSIVTCGQVLDIERFLVPACEAGAVVTVPNRHHVAFVRADEPLLEETVRHLGGFAGYIWSLGTYSVSRDLVAYRKGAWTTLTKTEGGAYDLTPLVGP